MINHRDHYTDEHGRVWTIESRDYGSGDIDYFLILPDETRISVTRSYR